MKILSIIFCIPINIHLQFPLFHHMEHLTLSIYYLNGRTFYDIKYRHRWILHFYFRKTYNFPQHLSKTNLLILYMMYPQQNHFLRIIWSQCQRLIKWIQEHPYSFLQNIFYSSVRNLSFLIVYNCPIHLSKTWNSFREHLQKVILIHPIN